MIDNSTTLYNTTLNAEDERSFQRSDLWMCNLCGKAFESHEYLDMHMENKHKDRMHIVSA